MWTSGTKLKGILGVLRLLIIKSDSLLRVKYLVRTVLLSNLLPEAVGLCNLPGINYLTCRKYIMTIFILFYFNIHLLFTDEKKVDLINLKKLNCYEVHTKYVVCYPWEILIFKCFYKEAILRYEKLLYSVYYISA